MPPCLILHITHLPVQKPLLFREARLDFRKKRPAETRFLLLLITASIKRIFWTPLSRSCTDGATPHRQQTSQITSVLLRASEGSGSLNSAGIKTVIRSNYKLARGQGPPWIITGFQRHPWFKQAFLLLAELKLSAAPARQSQLETLLWESSEPAPLNWRSLPSGGSGIVLWNCSLQT